MNYPKGFLWGSATSSHQVEGNNHNNDWWQWEEAGKTKTPSGSAADHYNRFNEDFELAEALGHNAHRFSIEWSRIEPQEGQFDEKVIAHYRNVLTSLKTQFITPIVTLHHFSIPLWLQEIGGWHNPRTIDLFVRYTQRMVKEFGEDIRYWITINEPMVYALYGYVKGLWPPGIKSHVKAFRVVNNMVKAHRKAYMEIHAIYWSKNWEPPMVGFAKNYRPFLVCPQTPNLFCRLGTWWRNCYFNYYYLNRVHRTLDFIGVNYYELEYDSNDPALKNGIFGDNCTHPHKHLDHINQLGWGVFPEGLQIVFDWLSKYKKPFMITENGTCEDDDVWRTRFIEVHVKEIDKAIARGIPIIGYTYWSLLDNFEWHEGINIRFGLIDVDYQTFKRTVRNSAKRYKELIEERQMNAV